MVGGSGRRRDAHACPTTTLRGPPRGELSAQHARAACRRRDCMTMRRRSCRAFLDALAALGIVAAVHADAMEPGSRRRARWRRRSRPTSGLTARGRRSAVMLTSSWRAWCRCGRDEQVLDGTDDPAMHRSCRRDREADVSVGVRIDGRATAGALFTGRRREREQSRGRPSHGIQDRPRQTRNSAPLSDCEADVGASAPAAPTERWSRLEREPHVAEWSPSDAVFRGSCGAFARTPGAVRRARRARWRSRSPRRRRSRSEGVRRTHTMPECIRPPCPMPCGYTRGGRRAPASA